MKAESGKFYFIIEIAETLKNEIIETSIKVIKLAQKGINIPFYDIIEMKNILIGE